MMNTSLINKNFVMTNLILNIKGKFTCEDAYNKVRGYLQNIRRREVKRTIERLRENDYLEETGRTYMVISKEKSTRWG